jgi:hypothetical protein
MRYSLLPATGALLAIALVACSHRTPPPDASAAPAKSTVLQVVNRNFYDFTIYLSRFGDRIRLGTATGNRTSVFEFPSQFVQTGTVRFEAHPVGGVGTAFTEELTVHPGDVVGVEITP